MAKFPKIKLPKIKQPDDSVLEKKFAIVWLHAVKGMADLDCQYKFHPTRNWKYDFAYPRAQVAIDIQGGIKSGGAHVRPEGYENDREKNMEATLRGWAVFELTPAMINEPTLKRIKEFITSRMMER